MSAPVGVSVTPFETRADVIVRLAQRADDLGLDHVHVPEGWTNDSFVLLTEMAMRTSRIRLGASIISVWSRTPAAIALGAAGVQRCSNGRFWLGLGASTPPLAEGLHGIRWERPVDRLRATLTSVRALLRGERLPTPAPGGRPLRLGIVPGVPVPIGLAALAPASIRLAGELADEWVPFLWARSRIEDGQTLLCEGEQRAEDSTRTRLSIAVPVALGPDEARARALAARWLGTYTTRMGPLYPRMLSDGFGMAAEVRAMVAAATGQREPELPPAAERLAREVTLFGTYEEAGDAIAAWFAAGAETLNLCLPPGCPEDEMTEIVELVARSLKTDASAQVGTTSRSGPARRMRREEGLSMVKPIEDVREISRIAYGFMASKALFSALHLDVFTRLEKRPQTACELAADTGVAEPRMQTLLSALAGIGLIVAADDRWMNAPASARYLVTGSRVGFGEYYKSQIDEQVYPLMTHLTDGLRGNVERLAGVLQGTEMADLQEAEQFSRAQHAGSLGPAVMLARRVDLSGASRLLDVAGGSGAFTITLCSRFPELRATILDFPNVVTVARRYVAEAGLSDRVDFLSANALDVDWPRADVVLMSYLLSAVRGSDIPVLLERARDALSPAGRLLIHDFMLDDDRQGPDLAALWFLQYLAVCTDTVSFTQADITAQVTDSGLVDIVSEPLVPGITRLVSAVRPNA